MTRRQLSKFVIHAQDIDYQTHIDFLLSGSWEIWIWRKCYWRMHARMPVHSWFECFPAVLMLKIGMDLAQEHIWLLGDVCIVWSAQTVYMVNICFSCAGTLSDSRESISWCVWPVASSKLLWYCGILDAGVFRVRFIQACSIVLRLQLRDRRVHLARR